MSARKAKRPRYRFCWWCSRQLHGNAHRVAIVDGREVIVHWACAKLNGLEIKEGAHLAPATGDAS